jgi:integrin beta 3
MWHDQSPHKHTRTSKRYPKAGLWANFCRNPDGHKTIWCYTTDPKKRWEECLPRKTCPPIEVTIEVKPKPTFGPEKCSGNKCTGYRGRQTKTISGKTCMRWDVQSPHKHNRTA